MKKIVFEGCATALITPMLPNGAVNYQLLSEIVEQQITGGIDALVICGTTGESSTLDHEEHVKVIETAVKQAGGRIPIIAGTGSNDTNYAVSLSREASAVGADALLMVTPYYNKTSQAGLIAHYSHIAANVDKPIILYNVPSRTGVNMKPETYKELSKCENIVAVKEANGDLSSVIKTIALCGDDLAVYSGNDDQTIPIMSLGGKGVISVLSNVVPNVGHQIARYCLDGDFKTATKLSVEYLDLMEHLFIDVNPIPVKEAMNLLGLDVGSCRLPLVSTSEANRKVLAEDLAKLGLLK